MPVLIGLNGSDVIDYQGTVTSVTPGSYSGGNTVLTLYDNATIVATIILQGDYSGDAFYTAAISSGVTQIGVLSPGDTATAPAGTSGADAYVWASVAGSWDAAGNWDDTTAGQSPASVAPGSHDSVTFDAVGGGGFNVVTGVGDSASLTIAGSTSLDGQFTTGTLTVNNNETLALSSGATLTATSLTASYNDTFDLTGATLTATSLTMTSYDDTFDLTGGTLTVGSVSMYEDETFSLSSGATLSITGNVTDTYGNSYYSINDSKFTVGGLFTSTNDYIYADGGGIVQLAGLAVATSSTIVLEVEDATSSIEIGTAGGVAAGSLTIDSGVTVTASGFFSRPPSSMTARSRWPRAAA